jgi:hypothetical protein
MTFDLMSASVLEEEKQVFVFGQQLLLLCRLEQVRQCENRMFQSLLRRHPGIWVCFHHALDEIREQPGFVLGEYEIHRLKVKRRVGFFVLPDHFLRVVTDFEKGRVAREPVYPGLHLIKQHTDTEDVAFCVIWFFAEHLRRSIAVGPATREEFVVLLLQGCEAKVDDY